MEERTIEYLPLDEVPSALKNPKQHDDDLLDSSFGRFGVVDIPVIDERTGRLVSGHGRRDTITRARDAGQPPPDGVRVREDGTWLVPVVRGWHSVDDEDAHAAGVAMNRASEAGGWDDRELTELLRELNEHDPLAGLVGTGYDEMVLANLVMVTRAASEVENFDAAAEWVGLPDYEPEERPWKLIVQFADNATREQFLDEFKVRDAITFTHADRRSISCWYPRRTAPVHDGGLRWEDDPLGLHDPADPFGVGEEGADPEGSLDGRLTGSDPAGGEPTGGGDPTALDPAHGALAAGAPLPGEGDGEGAEPGEEPVSGTSEPPTDDLAAVPAP